MPSKLECCKCGHVTIKYECPECKHTLCTDCKAPHFKKGAKLHAPLDAFWAKKGKP